MILTEYDQEKHLKSERRENYARGKAELLIKLVMSKIEKRLSCEEIADLFEMDPHVIQPIYDAVKANPDADEETIYQLLISPNPDFHF